MSTTGGRQVGADAEAEEELEDVAPAGSAPEAASRAEPEAAPEAEADGSEAGSSSDGEEGSGSDGDVFEVEPIRASKKEADEETGEEVEFFLVRWKGWTADDDTWEPRTNIMDVTTIETFEAERAARELAREAALAKKGGAPAKSSRGLVMN